MSATKRPLNHLRTIYDVLYGFIPITEWEEKIINSPFFQRLRWIKQLGFANYIFPGAEHNRFAHVIGVMHSMDQMIRSLGLAVPDSELFSRRAKSPAALFHKSLRIAALLHDIGTFPFSHAIENAYIRHGHDRRRSSEDSKNLPNSHEHLGSFIIKNTDFEGGLTRILLQYDFDPHLISRIIKGNSDQLIANQLMHSDLDADRMDYLIRDSHYTGIQYGQFDREYILANLTTFDAGNSNIGFGIRENAVHAVDDFLIARFSWYSQIIKNPGSAKFDIMSSYVAKGLLEEDLIHQFHDLLQMIEERDERFFWWNDIYFMNRCQELRIQNKIKDPRVAELTEMLLYRHPPKTVVHPLFSHRIIEVNGGANEKERLIRKINAFVRKLENTLEKYGTEKDWLVADLPDRDVSFTSKIKKTSKGRLDRLRQRDPIKVIAKDGSASLLVEREHTLMKHLSRFIHFVPSVYANESALKVLKARGLI